MFKDEKIIEMRNKWDNENNSDIYTGVYVEGELFEFEEYELFENAIKVMLPNKFVEMPDKMKKIKYPMDTRPQIIKTDLQGRINITFSLLNVKTTKETIEQIISQMKSMTQRLMPQYEFSDIFSGETRNAYYYGYEYVSSVVDGKMYNFAYGISVNGKFLHGIFNCPFQEKLLWKKTFLQICKSIIVIQEDK